MDQQLETSDERTAKEKTLEWLSILSTAANESLQAIRTGSQQRTTFRFGETLKHLLDVMDCPQVVLANRAGISPPQINAWVNPKDNSRDISANEVCRITWALADLMDRNQRRGVARAHLDILLNSLLLLAGYSSQLDFQDVVWRSKIARRDAQSLIIGWFDWPPFVSEFPNIGPTGFARVLTEHVCKFFHSGDIKFEKYPLYQMSELLRDRKIDMALPIMMRVPRRFSWLNFSESIPHLKMEFDGIMLSRRFSEILNPAGSEAHAKGCLLDPEKHLDFNRVEPIVAEGESTAAVIPIALKGINLQSKPVTGTTGHASDLIQSEILADKKKAQVLFTNRATCEAYRKQLPNDLTTLRIHIQDDWPQLKRMSLKLAFGVHPEEPKLIAAINESLRELKRVGYFSKNEIENQGLGQYYDAEEYKK